MNSPGHIERKIIASFLRNESGANSQNRYLLLKFILVVEGRTYQKIQTYIGRYILVVDVGISENSKIYWGPLNLNRVCQISSKSDNPDGIGYLNRFSSKLWENYFGSQLFFVHLMWVSGVPTISPTQSTQSLENEILQYADLLLFMNCIMHM